MRVDELQSMRGEEQSVLTAPSKIATATNVAAAVTTNNSDLAEMKALATSSAKANALQQQQLTTALARLNTLGTGGGGAGTATGGGTATAQEREKKRVEMLQKQLKEEREMEEMRAASGQPRQTVGPPAGRVPRVLRARACPDWQNRAPAGKVDVDVLATHQPQHRRRLPHGQGEGARAGG